MEALGIVSLVLGILSIIGSYWYVGVLLSLISLTLGAVSVSDSFSSGKLISAMGILTSILGIVMTAYFVASDLDSEKLVVQADKFDKRKTEVAERDDFMRFHKDVASVKETKEETSEAKIKDNQEEDQGEGITPYWISDSGETAQEKNTEDSLEESYEPVAVQTEGEEPEEQESNDVAELNSKGDILFEDENVSILYNGISKNETYGGYDIDFEVENHSNRTITVQVRETSINGYMVDPTCSIDVAPGKKSVDGMLIMGSDADRVPIDSINSIETKFHIFDYNDDDFSYDTENVKIK